MDRFILPHGRTAVQVTVASFDDTLSVFLNGAADTELDEFACGYLMGVELVAPGAGAAADVSFEIKNVLNSSGHVGEDLLGAACAASDLSGGAGDTETYMFTTPIFLDGKCDVIMSKTGTEPIDVILHIDSRWS